MIKFVVLTRMLRGRAETPLAKVAILGASQVVATACGFASTVVWARLMPQSDFGEYRLALAVVSIAGALSLMGLGQVAIMSAAQSRDGNFLAIVRTKAIGNLAGCLFIVAAAFYYWIEGSAILAGALFISACLFPAFNLSDIWNNWFNGKSWFGMLANGRIAQAILPLAGLAVAIGVGVEGSAVWLVLLVSMGGTGLLNLLMLHIARQRLSNLDRDDTLKAFGYHNTLALGFTALVPLDVIVLDHWHSATDVAVYTLAVTLPVMLKSVFSVFAQFLSPRVYQATSIQASWDRLRAPLLLLTAAFAALGILGFSFMDDALLILFSERYSAAIEPGRWLWLATCLAGSSTLLGIPLLATRKTFFVYGANIGYPLVLVSLFVALGPFGIIGMVIARITAIFALACFYCIGFYSILSREKRLSRNA